MRIRSLPYTLLAFTTLTFAQTDGANLNRPAVIPVFKICPYIEKKFGFKNDTPINLEEVKKFLNFSSRFSTLEPRATAEEIMQLSSADNIFYSCRDISEQFDFIAIVTFSYTSQAGPAQQTIKLRLVPPDEIHPPILNIPSTTITTPAGAAPTAHHSQ